MLRRRCDRLRRPGGGSLSRRAAPELPSQEPAPDGFATWPEALKSFGVPEEQWDSAYAIVDPEESGTRMFFQRVPEAKQVKNRLHLDVRVSDRSQPTAERESVLDAEADRLEKLGAHRLDWVEDFGSRFIVMQDVEANEFCLT